MQERSAQLPPLQAETRLSSEYVAAEADLPASPPSGGDFHDAFPVNDGSGKVAVVIGDVAGHGPEQTAQAEHMRELLADCLAVGLTPAETLTSVNALIEPDPNFEGFGTVFAGTIEAETGKLTYASGGHEPALIAMPSKAAEQTSVEELIGTGPPVGAFPADMARYEQMEAVLPKGGTLLLYTDGVSDASPPNSRLEWLGLDRLKAILAQNAAFSPRTLVSRLLGRVFAFCRGQFADDVAVLAVRRLSRRGQRKKSEEREHG
jgi:serine phosphatase RsbU (regulator of sigma subunit)